MEPGLRNVLKNLPHANGLMQFHSEGIKTIRSDTIKRYAKVATAFTMFYLFNYAKKLIPQFFEQAKSKPLCACRSIIASLVWSKDSDTIRPLVTNDFIRSWFFNPADGTMKNIGSISTDLAAILKFFMFGNAAIIQHRNLSLKSDTFEHHTSANYLAIVSLLSAARNSFDKTPNIGKVRFMQAQNGFDLIFVGSTVERSQYEDERKIHFSTLVFSPTPANLLSTMLENTLAVMDPILQSSCENSFDIELLIMILKEERWPIVRRIAILQTISILSFEGKNTTRKRIEYLKPGYAQNKKQFLHLGMKVLKLILNLIHIRVAGPVRASEYQQLSLIESTENVELHAMHPNCFLCFHQTRATPIPLW